MSQLGPLRKVEIIRRSSLVHLGCISMQSRSSGQVSQLARLLALQPSRSTKRLGQLVSLGERTSGD